MTNKKTSNASRPGPKNAASGPNAGPGAAAPARANPNASVDEVISQARTGRVNVSPAKAVEMAGQLYGRGQFGQAERVCRQIMQTLPANADARNILGVTLSALGRSAEAIEELRTAASLAPLAPAIHANLGEVLRQAGQLDDAKAALEEAVRLDPNNAQALNNLGIIHYERREFKDAVSLYRRALENRPAMAEALNNLGNALRVTGDQDGAIHAYQDALTHREIYPEVYNNLGALLQQQNRLEEAEHAFRKAISQSPRYIEAHNNLASLYAAQQKEIDALRVLSEALKIDGTNPQTLLITARIQLRRSNQQAAEQASRAILAKSPEDADALTVLGQVLHETDRYEEALEVLERAVKANPHNPEGLNFYGVALKSLGRLDEAREHMLDALRRNRMMYGAYANLSDLIDFSKGEGEELFEQMDKIFETTKNKEAPFLLPLHYAYAKALDDRGDHERALEHYVAGGKMKRGQLDYNETETHGFFDAIRDAFPKEVFENRKYEGLSDDRPVFIVGMPRSGSTLVEQILSSHPAVYGAGEVKYLSIALGKLRDRFPSLPKYPEMVAKLTPAQMGIAANGYLQALTANSGDAKKVTDKLLTNYFFVGLLNLFYPNAKVIHTLRDPVDTCLSGFTKLFKDDMPHSYDLGELGRYYGKYREVMKHWEEVLPEGFMTTVVYEDVVADTEKEAKRLIEFLGLPWDEKCVDFHKSDRPVKTASVAQVRKPIYKTSVQRWKKYGQGLQPLVDAIDGKVARPEGSKPKGKAKVKENA
jgi:tetratricopeptide (TPR) repeat protein